MDKTNYEKYVIFTLQVAIGALDDTGRMRVGVITFANDAQVGIQLTLPYI